MSAAITAAVIVAGGAAYAANQQRGAARDAQAAANRPTTGTIDNTTSTSPRFLPQDQINYALSEAQRIYDQGAPLYGGGYAPTGNGAAGQDSGPSTQSTLQSQRAAAARAAGITVQQQLALERSGQANYAQAPGGSGGSTSTARRPSMANQARTAGQAIIDQGMAGSPNQGAADHFIQSTLAPGGYGGNEVYQDLAGRYSNVGVDQGNNLLMQFLNSQGGNNYNTSASGQGSGAGRTNGGGTDGGIPAGTWSGASNGNIGGSYGASSPGVTIGDTTGTPGLFSDWAHRTLDGSLIDPNDPNLQAYLDVISRRGTQDLNLRLRDVGDEAAGHGMYGGSGLALERALTTTQGNQGIADARTTALQGFRGQGLQAMEGAAGLVNQRDIAAANNATQLEGTRIGASASSAAAAANTAAQLQIANRGLDLQGIQSYLQNSQFGLGQLGDIGAGIDTTRLGAMGQLGNTEALRYGGLNSAFGTANTLANQDAAHRAQQNAINLANANAPQQHLNDYLNSLGFFAGLGTDTRTSGQTTGTGPSQYINPGPSPANAGLTAGLGAWLQAYGAQRANSGTGGAAPTGGTSFLGTNYV